MVETPTLLTSAKYKKPSLVSTINPLGKPRMISNEYKYAAPAKYKTLPSIFTSIIDATALDYTLAEVPVNIDTWLFGQDSSNYGNMTPSHFAGHIMENMSEFSDEWKNLFLPVQYDNELLDGLNDNGTDEFRLMTHPTFLIDMDLIFWNKNTGEFFIPIKVGVGLIDGYLGYQLEDDSVLGQDSLATIIGTFTAEQLAIVNYFVAPPPPPPPPPP